MKLKKKISQEASGKLSEVLEASGKLQKASGSFWEASGKLQGASGSFTGGASRKPHGASGVIFNDSLIFVRMVLILKKTDSPRRWA